MNDQPPDPLLLDHDADGIRELDNNLPLWWVWLFYLCIAFAVFYMTYYHVLRAGELPVAEYEKEQALGERIKADAIGRFESNLASLVPLRDAAVLGQGLQIFVTSCAPCHRADGGGLVGPNLCDDYWGHGSNYVDTVKTIINGVPEKGMLTWRGVLKPTEIQSVASYIYTLRGTTPPNPKLREDQAPKDTGPNPFE